MDMLARPLKAIFLLLLLVVSAPLSADRVRGPALRGEVLARTAASMLVDIQLAAWIRDGQSKHVIYVFFDPNCPYCRRVYEGLRTPVELGEVELRWIPVGILMTTSLGKAAAMLEAANPTEALHRNERGFSTETGTFGGIEEEPVPREETLKRLERNLALLRRTGQDGVPSLLFRTRDGQAHFIRGAPSADALAKIVREVE